MLQVIFGDLTIGRCKDAPPLLEKLSFLQVSDRTKHFITFFYFLVGQTNRINHL